MNIYLNFIDDVIDKMYSNVQNFNWITNAIAINLNDKNAQTLIYLLSNSKIKTDTNKVVEIK